jgi:hypothetical protein
MINPNTGDNDYDDDDNEEAMGSVTDEVDQALLAESSSDSGSGDESDGIIAWQPISCSSSNSQQNEEDDESSELEDSEVEDFLFDALCNEHPADFRIDLDTLAVI